MRVGRQAPQALGEWGGELEWPWPVVGATWVPRRSPEADPVLEAVVQSAGGAWCWAGVDADAYITGVAVVAGRGSRVLREYVVPAVRRGASRGRPAAGRWCVARRRQHTTDAGCPGTAQRQPHWIHWPGDDYICAMDSITRAGPWSVVVEVYYYYYYYDYYYSSLGLSAAPHTARPPAPRRRARRSR